MRDATEPLPGDDPGAARAGRERPAAGLRPGAVLGQYRVVRPLGHGGMGAVYEVEAAATGARYALKVLQAGGEWDPEAIERFRREGELLARLDHPHVVAVHSAELRASPAYLVQELLTGGSLAERLAAGPLSVEEAAAIAEELAGALAHAHGQGVLHRDLKPENVLFGEQGEARLVDFGLGRVLAAGEAERLTATGTVLGTPAYMPPEQARGGRDVDARADVYGLGAVLYAMLTGRPPAAGGSLLATLDAVLRVPPPPVRELRPEVPPALEAVCLRALAKEPRDRYPTAEAFARALVEARTGGARRSRVATGRLVVGSALVAAALAGVAFAVARRPGAAASGPTAAAQPEAGAAPASDEASREASRTRLDALLVGGSAWRQDAPARLAEAATLVRALAKDGVEGAAAYGEVAGWLAGGSAPEAGPLHEPLLALELALGPIQAAVARSEAGGPEYLMAEARRTPSEGRLTTSTDAGQALASLLRARRRVAKLDAPAGARRALRSRVDALAARLFVAGRARHMFLSLDPEVVAVWTAGVPDLAQESPGEVALILALVWLAEQGDHDAPRPPQAASGLELWGRRDELSARMRSVAAVAALRALYRRVRQRFLACSREQVAPVLELEEAALAFGTYADLALEHHETLSEQRRQLAVAHRWEAWRLRQDDGQRAAHLEAALRLGEESITMEIGGQRAIERCDLAITCLQAGDLRRGRELVLELEPPLELSAAYAKELVLAEWSMLKGDFDVASGKLWPLVHADAPWEEAQVAYAHAQARAGIATWGDAWRDRPPARLSLGIPWHTPAAADAALNGERWPELPAQR